MSHKHKVFVYGTLRYLANPATHFLYGFNMFDTGKFPFIKPGHGIVYGNVIEVSDNDLKELDLYESVASGLYTRETVRAQEVASGNEVECFVYVAGPCLLPKRIIPSGDWADVV